MGWFTPNKHINILILGSNGMLGKELMEQFTCYSILQKSDINLVHGLDYPEIDLSNKTALANYFKSSIKYDYCINCAAITDTTGCEKDKKEQSYRVNSLAVKWISKACHNVGTHLIHISTDYVFSELIANVDENNKSDCDENMVKLPFSNDDDEFPVNTYGYHKLIGELFIKSTMNSSEYTILRVSWLYGKHNSKSFVHRFLRNCQKQITEQIQNRSKKTKTDQFTIDFNDIDEISLPTNCENVFIRICNIIRYDLSGTLNGCDYSEDNSGISRLQWAYAIVDRVSNYFPIFQKVAFQNKTFENQIMRYPTFSAMHSDKCDFLNVNTDNWHDALDKFIDKNICNLVEQNSIFQLNCKQ